MHKSVILIHTLPDGTSHFDWLIDQPSMGVEHRLLSFRCQTRPDTLVDTTFYGVAMPLHRAAYLTFEGDISGDRGSVVRVAQGEVQKLNLAGSSIQLTIRWAQGTMSYRGKCEHSAAGDWELWEFSREQIDLELDG